MYKRCPSCQNDNLPEALFCDNCGQPLAHLPNIAQTPAVSSAPASGGPLCPACHNPCEPGERFCGNCGAQMVAISPLPGAAASSGIHQAVQQPPSAEVLCTKCGKSNPATSAYCDECGTRLRISVPLPPLATTDSGSFHQPPPAPRPMSPGQGAMVSPAAAAPRLFVSATKQMIFLPGHKTTWVLGREDIESHHHPDVDLGPYGAEQLGISRSHAQLALQGDRFVLVDLGAVNYTFIKRQKLTPHVPHPLQNGDEIRLGKMVLIFYEK